MNILFLTVVSTFPVQGGEKLRSYGLIKMLSNLGHKVTAIINLSSEIEEIKDVKFIEFDFDKYKSNSEIISDFQIFRINKNLKKLINDILSKESFHIAFIDYAFQGQYISFFKRKKIKVIYGTHNVEAFLNLQRPKIFWRNYITHLFTYLLESVHEIFFFRKADALLTVSDKDKRFYQKFNSSKRVFLIPNMLDEKVYKIHEMPDENYIIMTGNFDAFQNSIGIEWFIMHVWCSELWERTKLLLVGLYSLETLEKLGKIYDCRNVEALGKVDDIKSYIKRAKASIVPLLDGSGTRLKCIEAMALKTQVISTSKGAEGIEHNGSILIANTPELFKRMILNTLEKKVDHTDTAYEIFMKEFSFLANEERLAHIIDFITKKPKNKN